MKLAYYEIETVLEISNAYVNTVVMENRKLLYELILDLIRQTQGLDGNAVLSEKDKPIPISKNLEIIMDSIGFSINRKPLINKTIGNLENMPLTQITILARVSL